MTYEQTEHARQLQAEIEAQSYRVRRCMCGPWWEWVNAPKGAHISQADYIAREVRTYARECRILGKLAAPETRA